jgi:exodeoxyribonuclease VII large subunit
VPLAGRRVTVVGRSGIVGTPLALLLSRKGVDATVTLAHSKTANLEEVCREADVLVAALGVPRALGAAHVKKGAIVVDVGIHRVVVDGTPLVGDVDAEAVPASPPPEPGTRRGRPADGGIRPVQHARRRGARFVSLFDDLPPFEEAAEVPPEPPAVWSVAALLRDVKDQLGRVYPEVTVKGEISSFKLHPSGHMYFTLKDADEEACLSCAFLKFQNQRMRFVPKDGMEVEARGVFDLYAPRGSFQLRVLELRPAGIGALLLAFEALRKKLAAEGLFDAAKKRPLPAYPGAIGLVTSPSGAAVRDLLHVLRRRWPGLRIVLAPVLVQGPGAALEIAAAIERFGRYGGVDVLIVGRGGGSLEDLWAFNEEVVVRAIAASSIPIVSAVGHESDTTLADFAADVRAATPSAAAELVTTPERAQVRRDVRDLFERAEDRLLGAIADGRERLASLRRTYGFRRPADLIATFAQGVDDRRASPRPRAAGAPARCPRRGAHAGRARAPGAPARARARRRPPRAAACATPASRPRACSPRAHSDSRPRARG